MEGAHPKILEKLLETNMEKTDGYGLDPYSESAREKIRKAVGAPEAEIYFLAGGTQTNETVISSVLRPYEGVIAANTGHVNTHEAGAIEHGGHKVLTIAGEEGRLSAEKIRLWAEKFLSDANHEHEVAPGMVYISHPTEYGTLYTKEELTKIREVCLHYGMKLFLDGARLGYGLAAEGTDLSLKDIAALTDVFYPQVEELIAQLQQYADENGFGDGFPQLGKFQGLYRKGIGEINIPDDSGSLRLEQPF